jgi:hypothetical protein
VNLEKIENAAPATPRECAFMSVFMLAVSLLIFALGDSGVVALCFGVVLVSMALLLSTCAIYPERWTYGFEVTEEGFYFKAPMRNERFIAFAEITVVTAAAVHNQFGESSITLSIHSPNGRAWVSEPNRDFYLFIEKIKRLQGFDLLAWRASDVRDYAFLVVGGIVPKKTTIFVRPGVA